MKMLVSVDAKKPNPIKPNTNPIEPKLVPWVFQRQKNAAGCLEGIPMYRDDRSNLNQRDTRYKIQDTRYEIRDTIYEQRTMTSIGYSEKSGAFYPDYLI